MQDVNEMELEMLRRFRENGRLKELEKEDPAYTLPGDTVLAIPDNVRLRRDRTQILFYSHFFLDTKCRKLPSATAVIVALFDGKRTVDEVSCLVGDYFGGEKELNDYRIRRALAYVEALRREDPLLFSRSDAPARPFRVFDVKDCVIPREDVQLKNDLEKPVSMMWMPTSACQTNCAYCYATRRPVPESELLPDGRVKELFDEAQELGIASVNLDGGDALCRKNIVELLAHATSRGVELDLSTKAYASKEMARGLYDAGLRIMQIGFDAPFPELFDKVVGSKGHFHRTIETIHNCTEAGIVCRTNSIIIQETYRHIHELVELLHTLPLRDMKIATAFRSLYRHRDGLVLAEPQKKWLREQITILKEKYPEGKIKFECQSDYLDLSEEAKNAAFEDFPRCGAGREIIIITPDGKVTMCEQSPQREDFVVGDVKRDSMLSVWQSNAVRDFKNVTREQFKDTVCYDCEEFDTCFVKKGGCFILALRAYGTRFAPHPACPKAPRYDIPVQ